MKSMTKQPRQHRYRTRSTSKNETESRVTKSISYGSRRSSASKDEELDKRLKSKYKIKELRVILHDYLYDKSLSLHTRCFLSFKNISTPVMSARDNVCWRSLPDLSADDFGFASNGYNDGSMGGEDPGILQDTKYRTTKESLDINGDDRLEGKRKDEWKVKRTAENNKDDNSTGSCESQKIKIVLKRSTSNNNHFVIESNSSTCSNEDISSEVKKTSYPNDELQESMLYTPRRYGKKWNPCQIHKKIKDISSLKEALIVTEEKISIDNNLNINNNCDSIQNRNEEQSWKSIKCETKGNLEHSLSSDEKYSDMNREKCASSGPVTNGRKRKLDSSKLKLRSLSLQSVNYSEDITNCNSKCNCMSGVGLTSVSALPSEHVSSVHKVDVVDIMHKPNDIAVVSPTLSKKDTKQVDTFIIGRENSPGPNPCTNKSLTKSSENELKQYFTAESMINGEVSINKENVIYPEITNFGFSEETQQIIETNCERQENEKFNGIFTDNDEFNLEEMLEINNHKSLNSVVPETFKSNSDINHSSRNSVDTYVDTFSNDNAFLNTEAFENEQSSVSKRKLPRITEDNILPKGTLNFLLKNRKIEKKSKEEDSKKTTPVTEERKLSENKSKINNDITERYFASFKDADNNAQSLPNLVNDEANVKETHGNNTIHMVDEPPSFTSALTADNLIKFNETTNDGNVLPNSNQIFLSQNEVNQTEETSEKVLPGKSSNKKHNKRESPENNKHNKSKKFKLDKSDFPNNSTEPAGPCPSSPLNSRNPTTERTELETNESLDKRGAKSFLEPDLALIEYADTIQMGTPPKNFSETSIETQAITQTILYSEEEQLQSGQNLPGNTSVEPALENCDFSKISFVETNEKLVETNKEMSETNEKLTETNVSAEIDAESIQKLTTNVSKKTKRNEELEEDDNDDVINLYVDEEDLISLCNTEFGNVNFDRPTKSKSKTADYNFRLDATRKETNNRKVPTESEHDNGSSSDSTPFDINLFIKETVKDFNKVYETLESSRNNETKFFRSRSSSCLRDNNRKMVADVNRSCMNGFNKESAMPANIKKSPVPLMSVNLDMKKLNYQEVVPDRKIELPFYSMHKMFSGYCFTLLKFGSCYKEDMCHFIHDIKSLVQQICHNRRDHYFVILDYLVEKQFSYIAKITYMDILLFSDTDHIVEFYKKLVEGQFLNYMTVYSTVNTLLRKKMSLTEILSALISPLQPNAMKLSSIILDVVEKHIPAGEYWKTLREVFLKIRPSANQVRKILTECVTAAKDYNHVEDVNKNVVMLLSKAERGFISEEIMSSFYHYVRCKRQQFNASQAEVQNDKGSTTQNTLSTIASPDPIEKTTDAFYDTMKITSVDENSVRSDTEHVTSCTKTANSVGVSDDGNSFVLHPIDDLPEPSSAHRDRFWKFNLDVMCLREGLKHFDYEYVRDLLDKYADFDQRTLIARSFYNILCMEIKRSQSHLNNIIEISVQAGSLAALDAVIQAGKYVLKAFVHEALWGFAYILQKLLQPYNSRPDAEVILILAEIYIANRRCLKAFTLLKQYNIIYANRTKWRVPSKDDDSKLRVIVISLLLEMICKESVQHAFFLFDFLLREQTYNYSPIDLTRYVNKLMSQLLTENCIDTVKAMTILSIKNNFTFNTTTFRALITYLYHHDMTLAKQMYRYGMALGVYNAVSVSLPVSVHINVYWTEEEIYFLLAYLFEKLVKDIGPGIERLGPNVLKIYIFFEAFTSDYKHDDTMNSEEVKRLQTFSRNTVKKVLQTRFTPFITIVKRRISRMLKLQSKSVVNYLKSIS